MKTQTSKIEYDKCVSCGRPTNTPSNAHVDERSYYVEGAGQLCPECWRRIYG